MFRTRSLTAHLSLTILTAGCAPPICRLFIHTHKLEVRDGREGKLWGTSLEPRFHERFPKPGNVLRHIDYLFDLSL